MNLNHYLDRYLIDKTYTITIKENEIYIINYIELEDFSDNKVVINHKKGKTIILGTNLIISKMLKDELLITGKIKNIQV